MVPSVWGTSDHQKRAAIEEWETYQEFLSKKCGMDDLLQVYQDAYNRYIGAAD